MRMHAEVLMFWSRMAEQLCALLPLGNPAV